MFVSKRAFRAAQDEIVRLRAQLGIAQRAEADYQSRARDLTDAMITARADAREVRLRAEQEAAGHLSRARQEATALAEAAQVQVATARAEVERLEALQRDLGASVERSLAALRSALTNTGTPVPADAVRQPAAEVSYEDALPRFLSEVTTTQPGHVPATYPSPAQTLRQRRSSPRCRPPSSCPGAANREVSTPSVLRGGDSSDRRRHRRLGACAFLWIWFSRQTRRPVPAGTLASSSSATPTARPVRLAPAGASKSDGATPPVAAPARQLHPAGVGVTLRALRDVWVRVDVDGRRAVGRLVRAGEQFTYGAEREVTVRAGDAGALLISVNGHQSAVLGGDGVVLTKRITTTAGRRALDLKAPSRVDDRRPKGALPAVLALPRDDRRDPSC